MVRETVPRCTIHRPIDGPPPFGQGSARQRVPCKIVVISLDLLEVVVRKLPLFLLQVTFEFFPATLNPEGYLIVVCFIEGSLAPSMPLTSMSMLCRNHEMCNWVIP